MSIYNVFPFLKTMQTLYFLERGDAQLFPDTKILKFRLLEKEKSGFENEVIGHFKSKIQYIGLQ